jgi:hypothetical protein
MSIGKSSPCLLLPASLRQNQFAGNAAGAARSSIRNRVGGGIILVSRAAAPCGALLFCAALGPSPAQIALLDRDPMTDTAIGSIEGSRTRISGQLPHCREGQAVSGSDRMQGAVRVNLPTAAPDENLSADNLRAHRARVGTSGARERPYPVEILVIVRHRVRRFFDRSFRFVARFGKECQPDALSDGVAVT